jgi:sarcosine oxidase subunit alpha
VRSLPTTADPDTVKAFVDFQNDVTAKDIGLALREGFESIEHLKRYTTTGMATDQGKTSNMAALGLVAERLNRPVPQVGTTTFRMPYTPVTFGALIGAHRGALFDPLRETPSHSWAASRRDLPGHRAVERARSRSGTRTCTQRRRGGRFKNRRHL